MGNKSILMSIRPQYVAKILNGEKTIEVRKKFPKDYVGWVYIYCTKSGLPLMRCSSGKWFVKDKNYDYDMRFCYYAGYNGKVVARFWCDKVEEIKVYNVIEVNVYKTDELCAMDLCKKSCLTQASFERYLGNKNGYAIHISNLKIFEEPKEIKNLYKLGAWKVFEEQFDSSYLKREQQEIMEDLGQVITKAPQNFCYVEDTL